MVYLLYQRGSVGNNSRFPDPNFIFPDSYAPSILFADGRCTLLRAAQSSLNLPVNHIDSFAIDCKCGGTHSVPLTLRHAVENEPFEGSVDNSVEESSVDGEADILSAVGEHTPKSNLPSTFNPFSTPDEAPKSSRLSQNASALSETSTTSWTTPVEDPGTAKASGNLLSAQSPPGEETQELMTQPLLTAPTSPVDNADRGAQGNVSEAINADDVEGAGSSGRGGSRSGSQSLFSSGEKDSPQSSGEPCNKDNEVRFKW